MAGYLIWLPKPDGDLSAELLHQLGLDFIEPTGHNMARMPGPDGTGREGLMIAVEPSPAGRRARCLYRPEEQRWEKVIGDRVIGDPVNSTDDRSPITDHLLEYYFGWDPADPPRPEDLERPKRYFGYPVRLADGHVYQVPIVQPHGTQTFRRQNGRWSTPMPDDSELQAGCARYWDAVVVGVGEKPDYDQVVDLAARALSVHYRLGPEQLAAWSLLDKSAVDACLSAMLDVPAVLAEMAARKKNDTPPAGSTSTATTEALSTADP